MSTWLQKQSIWVMRYVWSKYTSRWLHSAVEPALAPGGGGEKATKTNILMSSAMMALVLAALPLLIIVHTKPARAAFPSMNGKIVYEHDIDIWTMNPDGTAKTKLVGNNDNNSEVEPAVSPDGTKIAYRYDYNIWIMNSDGTNPRKLTDHPAGGGGSLEPAWSPSGTKIAFARWLGSGHTDIWVMDADGSNQTDLTNTPNNDEYNPAWSPDGLQIAYTLGGCDSGGGSCIYTMLPNGLGQTNLTTPDDTITCPPNQGGEVNFMHISDNPSWSPDSSKLAFESEPSCGASSGSDIWVMNRTGTNKEDLIQDDGTVDKAPSFSPDGQHIAFESERDDPHGEIYAMDASGNQSQSGLTRLTSQPGFDLEPDWGPLPRKVSIPDLALTEEARITKPNGTCGYDTNPGQPVTFLSVDEHDFFDTDSIPDPTPDGNTRIYGTITVKGTPGDALKSLELEIDKDNATIKAQLAPTASTTLIKPFPSTGVLKIANRQLLFVLTSAEASKFKPILSTGTDPILTLRVIATTQNGGSATKTYTYGQTNANPQGTTTVHQLVLYDGNNRYPIPRDAKASNANEGGDGWVLPSLDNAAWILSQVNPGTVWGDFSNMNGGAICPHKTHQEGRDVDGDALAPNAWYDARNAATANDILAMLNQPTYGTRIEKVFVTYNKPGGTRLKCENGNTDTNHSAFYTTIQNQTVPAPGGGTRSATSVIRSVAQHCGHFHIQFFPT